MPNVRVLTMIGVVCLIVGFPLYQFVSESISGGIRNRGDYLEVDLKAMSSFEFDQKSGRIEDVPQQWRELDGKRVSLRGEMYAGNSAGADAQQVELVYSVAKCCFSGEPQVQHFVLLRPGAGRAINVYSSLVEVVGTLRVKVENDHGKVSRIFSVDVEKVDPV